MSAVATIPVVQFTIAGRPSEGLGRPYTCVYDGTCKVCTRLSGVLRKWDRNQQIEVVPSQAPGVTARFPWIQAVACGNRPHLQFKFGFFLSRWAKPEEGSAEPTHS